MINIGTDPIQGYYFVKKFNSKRNEVWLIEDKENNEMILKKFSSKKCFRKELEVHYYLLKEGCNVPEIYQIGLDYIVMEYIPSITLYDYIMECENQVKSIDMKVIESFVMLLEGIYTSDYFKGHNMILNDTNLRNFLVNGEKVYMVDFEGTNADKDIQTDIAGFIAFFLTYNPCFSQWKLKELKSIISFLDNRYNCINYGSIRVELESWIEFLANRRNIHYSDMEGYRNFLNFINLWEN